MRHAHGTTARFLSKYCLECEGPDLGEGAGASRRAPASSETSVCGVWYVISQSEESYFAEMRSGSEEGLYLRVIGLCITQL